MPLFLSCSGNEAHSFERGIWKMVRAIAKNVGQKYQWLLYIHDPMDTKGRIKISDMVIGQQLGRGASSFH